MEYCQSKHITLSRKTCDVMTLGNYLSHDLLQILSLRVTHDSDELKLLSISHTRLKKCLNSTLSPSQSHEWTTEVHVWVDSTMVVTRHVQDFDNG